MNFWTFLDRNMAGVVLVLLVAAIMTPVAIAATHADTKPTPCVCSGSP